MTVNINYSLIGKVLLVVLFIGSIFTYGRLTLMLIFLDSFMIDNKPSISYYLVPFIISSLTILLALSEILKGYNPKSDKYNKISLLILLVIITVAFLIQFEQLKLLFGKLNLITIVSIVITFFSYFFLIKNRVKKVFE